MANPELLVKVGPGANYRDGEVIAVRPPGVLISPAEIQSYFATGVVPASVQSLGRARRKELKRRILYLRFTYTHTAADIATVLGCTVEDAARVKARDAVQVQVAQQDGIDTSFGFRELYKHLAVAVTNLETAIGVSPLEFVSEIKAPNLPEDDWRGRAEHRRCWIADWRLFVTPVQQAIIDDPDQIWTCKRNSPLDATLLLRCET